MYEAITFCLVLMMAMVVTSIMVMTMITCMMVMIIMILYTRDFLQDASVDDVTEDLERGNLL